MISEEDVSRVLLGIIQQSWYLFDSAACKKANELGLRINFPMKSGINRTSIYMMAKSILVMRHGFITLVQVPFAFYCISHDSRLTSAELYNKHRTQPGTRVPGTCTVRELVTECRIDSRPTHKFLVFLFRQGRTRKPRGVLRNCTPPKS